MMSNPIKLMGAASCVAILLVSCSRVGKTAIQEVEEGIVKKAVSAIEHPPPKPVLHPEAGQSLKALIERSGERARQAQASGKEAALAALQSNQQISDDNLWKVAYDTVLDQTERLAVKATKQELREMASMIVTEVRQKSPAQNNASTTSQSHFGTIVGQSGSKNVRTGPGTAYSVSQTVNVGDRVQVLGKSQDQSGYIWYKVSFPNSRDEGWIAAQLIQLD